MRLIALLFVLGWTPLIAQTEDEPAEEFSIKSVIHASVADLKPPQWYPEIVSYDAAVSANSKLVQKHVSQGMALIHGGWDFEAYRHFVEAVKKDPDCLMAYWGIALSLANPNSEVVEVRLAAVNRMISLVNAGAGTSSERGQAEALAFFFSEQPERTPEIFATVSEDYPNNLQLKLMSALLKRDGYDDLLGPGPGQRAALKEVEEILMNNTDSQMALSFWIALQAEHPDATGKVRETVLPRVRKLASYSANFPPYRELLGHFEKRAGNLRLAKIEFKKAIELYEKKMADDGYQYYDCPNLLRAYSSLAGVLMSLGEFDDAFAIARKLSKMPIMPERLYSPGATLLLWEGKTLGARICLARGQDADFQKGLGLVPDKEEGKKLSLMTPAVMAWEAWRLALATREAIQKQTLETAPKYLDAMAAADGLLEDVRSVVSQGSSRQSWERTRKALKVEWMLAKAALIDAQMGKRGMSSTSFWLQSAIDERESQKGIFPPLSLSLPPVQKALHLFKYGEQEEAKDYFKMAMADYANDVMVLQAYADSMREIGSTKKADAIDAHIRIVTKGE